MLKVLFFIYYVLFVVFILLIKKKNLIFNTIYCNRTKNIVIYQYILKKFIVNLIMKKIKNKNIDQYDKTKTLVYIIYYLNYYFSINYNIFFI